MQNKKNLKPIPAFKNEKEESLFWDTHDTTEYFDFKSPITMKVFLDEKAREEALKL